MSPKHLNWSMMMIYAFIAMQQESKLLYVNKINPCHINILIIVHS